jgi:hypothetical protein
MAGIEKTGLLALILETLRDGAPRLQLVLLNILNLIFLQETAPSAASNSQKEEEDPADTALLSPIRGLLIKSTGTGTGPGLASVTQSLLKLSEHGASNTIKGKALIALQLICRYSPQTLFALTEKKLPTVSPLRAIDIVINVLI